MQVKSMLKWTFAAALLCAPVIALPDLNVTTVQTSVTETPPPGEGGVFVRFVIRNSGDQTAFNFTSGVYAAQSSSCSVTQGERLINTFFVPSLPPGAEIDTEYFLAAAPGETIIYGRVRADIGPGNGVVTESNENNNCKSTFRLTVSYPDLIIENTSGPNPNLFVAGDTTTQFNVGVKNFERSSGNWAAGPSTTGYFLSTASSNPPGKDRLTQLNTFTPSLAPNELDMQQLTITIPEGTPEGTYNLFAKADVDGDVVEGQDENNNFSSSTEIEVVDICTFTDFNESGSVDVLDLTQLVNDLGDSVYLGNQRRNVKKSHHPFPEVINRVDLLAAVGCWNARQALAQGGSLHDLSLVTSGNGYAVRTLLSGNVSSVETMLVLPAGIQLDVFSTNTYDVVNSNFVEDRYPGQINNQIYTLNTFPSYFNNYSSLTYNNYQPLTFDTQQNISLGSLQSLAPGETFTSGVAVQVVFADGQVATLQKKFAFVHAPDANFRNALKTQLGLSSNQAISTALAQTVTSLTLNNANISDLSGLEQFTNLTHLSLANNAIQSLPDLSGFTNLETLNISGNQIYRLPNLPAGLETLDIADNGLWDLPSLNYLTQLESLDVSGNRLTELPALVGLTALETLIANEANLTSLPTLPLNLTYLEAEHNNLMSLPEFKGPIVQLHVRHNFISNVSSLKGAIDTNTTHVVLDHNMLDGKFCEMRDYINKASLGNLQTFTYTKQLIPQFNCFSAISL